MRTLPGAQQSDAWLKARIGRITGSRIGDVMSFTSRASKSGPSGSESAKRKAYRRQLIAERLTGRMADHFVSSYMERGSDIEPEARAYYEMATQTMVEPVGFVLHPVFDFTGASPDGLVVEDGILEIKAPKTETLLGWMEDGEIPEDYVYQMQWEMACTERKWCHFYGYDDRLPADIRHMVREFKRDDEMIQKIEDAVCKLHEEIEEFIAKLGLPPTIFTVDPASVPDYDEGKSFSDNCDFLDVAEMIP